MYLLFNLALLKTKKVCIFTDLFDKNNKAENLSTVTYSLRGAK